ncbi:MAG: ABC transporter substrate-binding protein [Clostridiales bacterium]|nr:ABC transporter substrate-binding protein [Candidatus Blautia equi]
MKRSKQISAIALAGTMVLGMTGSATAVYAEAETPLVIACADMNEKFSEFFASSVPDQNVADMTAAALLSNDRAGEIIYHGIEGETKNYNGTDYFYEGIANCDVTENEDGTVDYVFTLRDDVKFADGEVMDADDVIFSMYAYLDPSYDGSSSLYALPIKGLDAYRSGTETLYNVILAGGEENTDFSVVSEEQQKQFFEVDWPAAQEAFAQSICDYCTAAGYIDIESSEVANGMLEWGFGSLNEDGTFFAPSGATWTLEGDDVPTLADYWTELVAAYDGDIDAMSETEQADMGVYGYLPEDYLISVETGESAPNVEGIEKVDDKTVKVTLTEVDATAIYQLGIAVQPLHYYGDAEAYNYEENNFGFPKGDLSIIRSKTTCPMGAGPYVFEKYENKIAYLKANEYYYKGAPKVKNIQFKTTSEADNVPAVVQGTVDVSEPSISKEALANIKGENSNGEAVGDVLAVTLVDYRGYGYIGMNSKNVMVGEDAGSAESKALRKAIGTVLSVSRDVVIDSYYGEAASVINYPISNTSWAAPQKSDPDYKVAFSVDVDGNDIYTDGMSQEEKEAAALQAALGFFEAAGYTVENGVLTAAPEGAKLSYELMIGGGGTGDHPSMGIVTAASEALKTIGFDLVINDLTDTSVLWNAIEGNTAEIWCAAWSTTIDPDMFQIYHSEGGSAGHYAIYNEELDEMIMEARTNTDQAFRKAKYKECLDFVVDYAVEIPIYQRQEAELFSTQRINMDTVTPDQTTYYGWMSEIEKVEMN